MYNKVNQFKYNNNVVELVQTDEFDRFKRAPGNRQPEPAHVRNLTVSIKKNQLFTSIIVNEHWEIIDGQHRKQAFETLGIPVLVHVVHGLKAEDIKTYNINMHNWNNDHYLAYYMEMGNGNYAKYHEFKERTGMSHGICRSLLTGLLASGTGGKTLRDSNQKNSQIVFQKGEMIVSEGNQARAYKLAALVLDFDFRHKMNQNFVGAFQQMYGWFSENGIVYDHTRLKHAFKLYGRDYENKPKRVFEFKMDLQKLYNHRKSGDNKIIFLTPEEMAKEWAA